MSGAPLNPRVKVCGVTRPEDAALAAELGAALVGLNFWPGSPRCVEPSRAREVAAALAGRALAVGVFVDQDPGRIEELVAEIGLDLVQLHGREPAAVRARFGTRQLAVVRAGELAAEERRDAPPPFAFLVEAPRAAGVGGTGRAWEWGTARPWIRGAPAPALVAGGVAPGNAARALAESGAAGVDVASGVESAPGIKDAGKMRRLFEELRRAAT